VRAVVQVHFDAAEEEEEDGLLDKRVTENRRRHGPREQLERVLPLRHLANGLDIFRGHRQSAHILSDSAHAVRDDHGTEYTRGRGGGRRAGHRTVHADDLHAVARLHRVDEVVVEVHVDGAGELGGEERGGEGGMCVCEYMIFTLEYMKGETGVCITALSHYPPYRRFGCSISSSVISHLAKGRALGHLLDRNRLMILVHTEEREGRGGDGGGGC